MKKYSLFFFLLFFSGLNILYSCGKENAFTSKYSKTNKEKAEDAIANNNYDEAVSLLNVYIAQNPTDYSAQSMLANVYMLKAGINLLDLLVNISNNMNVSKSNLYTIINSFPSGNSTNVSFINTALQILSAIPSTFLTTDQRYQIAVANSALAFLIIKEYTLDASGNISTSAVSGMSAADVNIIYNALLNVQSVFNSLGVVAGSGNGSGMLLEIINQVTSSGNPSGLVTYLITNA